MSENSDEPPCALFAIGGYNGHSSVRAWADQLLRNSSAYTPRTYSWWQARSAARDIAVLQQGRQRVILIGHSLGGGRAELLVQQLPKGAIDILVTVAAFAPRSIDHSVTRAKVGYWLNIISRPDRRDWRDTARRGTAPFLLRWNEQGAIPNASDNFVSHFPHHDFYKMMSERCGAVEHGRFRL